MNSNATPFQTDSTWPGATSVLAQPPRAHTRFSRRLTDSFSSPVSSLFRYSTRVMQHTMDRISAMRECLAAPSAPTPQSIQARRRVILAMPEQRSDDLRRKLLAMMHTDARLLPADTDVDALLAMPLKAQCLCDPAVISSMMHMRDEGLTLRPAAFLTMDDAYVPFRNGKLDFDGLETRVDDMLASGETFDAKHPVIAALNQLLDSGLFNACVNCDGIAFPLALHLRTGIERLATCYQNDFAALLNHLPRVIVNLPNHCGNTPLVLAIQHSRADLVTALLRRGVEASLNLADAHGVTPLLSAVRSEQAGIVRALLIMGADASLDRDDARGMSPLRTAVAAGMMDIVRLLLPYASADALIRADTRTGATPLLLATRGGHAPVVRMLLEHGAGPSVDTRDAHGMTPLQAANDCVEVVMMLLTHGADLSALRAPARVAIAA